ncbi:hypothetical protein ACHQM5_005409 [Ranunculus cassubicifolius]
MAALDHICSMNFWMKSGYHKHLADIGIRVSMGIFVAMPVATLPLSSLITQGLAMKPTMFNERTTVALKKWHHTRKKHT